VNPRATPAQRPLPVAASPASRIDKTGRWLAERMPAAGADWNAVAHILPELMTFKSSADFDRAMSRLGAGDIASTRGVISGVQRLVGQSGAPADDIIRCAVHEAGHIVALAVLMGRAPCCAGVTQTRPAAGRPIGRVVFHHRGDPGYTADIRDLSGFSQAGAVADQMLFGSAIADSGDAAIMRAWWRNFAADASIGGAPVSGALRQHGRDLAAWALAPNTGALREITAGLVEHAALAGSGLFDLVAGSGLLVPDAPRPLAWTVGM
jgi:hypothetical protein